MKSPREIFNLLRSPQARPYLSVASVAILLAALVPLTKGPDSPPIKVSSNAPSPTATELEAASPVPSASAQAQAAAPPAASSPKGILPVPQQITGFKPANLFTPAEDRVGITKDKIVFCTHAALSLAAALNVSEKSINVYWEYVNRELGGIHGRKVEMTYADDNYATRAEDVTAAYEKCAAKNPFMLLGGIGIDTSYITRTFAERDHRLYIHHTTVADPTKKYSYSYVPTVEDIGRRTAEFILAAHPGKSIGVIYRNSEYWEPGRKAFKAELARRGANLQADLPAEKNATLYTTQIRALANEQVKVVFIWENALVAVEIIRQAKDQGYTPQWVVFPFNLMSSALGADTVNPIPVEGMAYWAPYLPGRRNQTTGSYPPGKTDGSYAPYKDLIKEFERMHDKYAAGENRDDLVFIAWLGWVQIHKLMAECGPDCSRNTIVGLLNSGLHKADPTACPLDSFNDHVGSDAFSIFKAFQNPADGQYGWDEIQHCKTSF